MNKTPLATDLISLRQAAKISGLSPNHLRLLAGNGELWALKIDTYWFTTEEAVLDYVDQDNRPGPKPK